MFRCKRSIAITKAKSWYHDGTGQICSEMIDNIEANIVNSKAPILFIGIMLIYKPHFPD